jgi:hypothetical protein
MRLMSKASLQSNLNHRSVTIAQAILGELDAPLANEISDGHSEVIAKLSGQMHRVHGDFSREFRERRWHRECGMDDLAGPAQPSGRTMHMWHLTCPQQLCE